MSDPEDERSSQPGEIDATPVGTNEDDVATGADAVGIQIPENVTVRRSSGAAGPTVDSSRSAISSLMPTRGPAEEINEHEKACQNLKVAIDSFYSAHPLSENYSMVFARSCDKPMPPVPPDDELLQFLALDSSEISELDIHTVRLVLRSRMDEYEDMCTAVLDSVKYEKIKSRRSSVGEVNPQEKYASSPVEELGNGKNRFPPRAVPNFFKWERHPAGVQPPLHLYTRYCVYADLFRLGYDGRLTTFGEAYQNTVDSKWGQKTQEFAQQHSTSKGNGGGGGGKGKKGGGGGNRKIFKSN